MSLIRDRRLRSQRKGCESSLLEAALAEQDERCQCRGPRGHQPHPLHPPHPSTIPDATAWGGGPANTPTARRAMHHAAPSSEYSVLEEGSFLTSFGKQRDVCGRSPFTGRCLQVPIAAPTDFPLN